MLGYHITILAWGCTVQVHLDYRLDLSKDSVWLTMTPTALAKATIPYIQEAGDFYAYPDYYTRRDGLSSYLIKYTLSGQGFLEYDGRNYNVLPGQAFWIDCTKPQFYRPDPAAGHWHLLWVHFYGPSTRQYYRLFETQNNHSCVVTLPPKFETGTLLRQILRLYEGGDSSFSNDIFTSSLITSLMTQCILGASAPLEWEGMPEYVIKARSHLLDTFQERHTLEGLAEMFSVNKFYFQKQFKRFTGYTPNDFLLTTRINRAKELLRTRDDTVTQIASQVGMDNVSHFIVTFKKREGVTPSVYRSNWYRS